MNCRIRSVAKIEDIDEMITVEGLYRTENISFLRGEDCIFLILREIAVFIVCVGNRCFGFLFCKVEKVGAFGYTFLNILERRRRFQSRRATVRC